MIKDKISYIMKIKLIFLISLFILSIFNYQNLFAQGNVGIGTTTPHNCAILDIESTSKGLLIPRMTTLDRLKITDLYHGLLVYDQDFKKVFYYDGNSW
jgi:hypothetical protein